MTQALLPPLHAVRVFEAAGRYGSFTRATQALHVTPGAVSRQVAQLEAFLGVPLFERRHREVALTPEGQAYLLGASEALDILRARTQQLRATHSSRPLHIGCPVTFGMKWLAPRLPAFRARHPSPDVVITTALSPIDATRLGADIAIRIGEGQWPGLHSERLLPIDLIPVCSPALLASHGGALCLADLAHLPLLRSAVRPEDWDTWLASAGVEGVDPARGMTMGSASLCYQFAAEGAGVAMGQYALVADDLARGRLVAPFDHVARSPAAFYLIVPPASAQAAPVRAFAEWIRQEAARQPPGPGG